MGERDESASASNGGMTGSPPGMLQNDSRGLSKWLAGQPDARLHAREAAEAICNMTEPTTPAAQPGQAGEAAAAVPTIAERAALMLSAYVECIKADGNYDLWHYIPEVEYVAQALAAPAQPQAAAVPTDDSFNRRIGALQSLISDKAVWRSPIDKATALELTYRLIAPAQPQAAAVPTHKLVPIEPTEEMQVAGRYVNHDNAWELARGIWKAMLAAAPAQTPPQPDSADRRDAQRYRWLRDQNCNTSDFAVVHRPKFNLMLGAFCPFGELMDQQLDEAMAPKEAP